eukprot:CAMPEP_0119472252 /NCGR_PEP_ID=MMETSP1344-20130328/4388_1 /TAXON_ID=236787 /ORGANISM="Florenciella parvula, Strain CCMP2471" /LENGTH=183 /DNA_ID=CAMNT_0007505169 /DNA_START=328 /DNA_END=876 /DNA_ORIENTATION=+
MVVSIHIVPSDQMLLSELSDIKDEQPGIGIQRLSGQVHERHPSWRVNAKRVRKLLKAHGLIAPPPGSSPQCVASPLELSQSTQSDNSEEAAEKDLSSSICSNASASGDDQDRGLERSAAASSFILNAEARGSGFVVVEEKAPAAKAAAEAEAEEMAMGAMDDEEWAFASDGGARATKALGWAG